MPTPFQVVAPFAPVGDQPRAIEQLASGFAAGQNRQTLLGVTGSGKTFTAANACQTRRLSSQLRYRPSRAFGICAMFTLADMRALVQKRPFVAFRLWLSDSDSVDVRSPDVVMLGKRFAIVGLLDADAIDTVVDRYSVVWYDYVSRHQALQGESSESTATSSQSETPIPILVKRDVPDHN